MTGRTYEPLPRLETGTAAWHEARRTGIGASEAAAVLGLSPWQTPLQVYEAKHGKPNEINENLAYFGHALEPVIAGWVTKMHRDQTGMLTSGFAARSIQWPFLTASPDRCASDGDDPTIPIPVELKTSSAYAKSAWVDDDGTAMVPAQYQVQVQTQCAVLGADHGWLAVLHGGNEPGLYRIDRDDEFIDEVLVPGLQAFWEDHVLTHTPPEPMTTAEAIRVWPGDPEESVEATDELALYWADLGKWETARKEAEQEIERIRLDIQLEMQNASILTRNGAVLATWKPRAGSRRLDTAALKRDHPGLAAEYTVQGDATRVFLRKTAREVTA